MARPCLGPRFEFASDPAKPYNPILTSDLFMQVSGIAFAFYPSKPPRSRVEAGSVTVNGTPLRLDAP